VHGVTEKETYETLSTAVNDWTLGYMYIERNEKKWGDEGVNMINVSSSNVLVHAVMRSGDCEPWSIHAVCGCGVLTIDIELK
jgi:hypothetical protein